MKSRKVLAILVIGLLVSLAMVGYSSPMGTAWTYQGRLMDANDPAEGLYDFEFRLFDDPCAGTQQGGTIEVNDLDVTDGYFTVELDFGSDVFNGNARWLETTVAQGGGSDPYTLRPRFEVTAVPYALQTRGIFVGSNENVGIGTKNPKEKLEVKGKLSLTGAAYSTMLSDDGGGLMIDTSRLATSAQVRMLPYDNDIWLQNTNSAGDICLSGYAGEDLIGDIILKTSGNVGIGMMNPASKLDVAGNIGVSGTIDGVDLSTHAASVNAHHTLPTTLPPSGSAGGDLSGNYPNPSVVNDSHTHGDSTVSNSISINNSRLYAPAGAGNVGIGTTSPSEKLDIAGNIDVSGNRVKNYRGFPRPDYDSGWQSFEESPTRTFTHSLGGNVDNYVVDMQLKDLHGWGINNNGLGGDRSGLSFYGACWDILTTSQIRVHRELTNNSAEYIRIRIWVYD